MSLLLAYLFLDSPPLVVVVGAADEGWDLVVVLLLLLLLVRTYLEGSHALHLFTACGFLNHRTAVLLRAHRNKVKHVI